MKALTKKTKRLIIAIVSFVVVALSATAATLGIIFANKKDFVISYMADGKVYKTEYDGTAKLSDIQVPSVEGYTFEGWYADPSYGVQYSNDTVFSKDTVIYPLYKANEYSVVFHSNGDNGESEVNYVKYNSSYKVIPNSFERENYTFVGWSLSKDTTYDQTDKIIKKNTMYTLMEEGADFYAVWKGVEKTVSFDFTNLLVDNAEYTLDDQIVNYGETFTFPTIEGLRITNSTNNTYYLACYKVTKNGQSLYYKAGDQITVTEDFTVELDWQIAPSALYLSLNTPVNAVATNISPVIFANKLDTYSYIIPDCDDTTNYEFLGWNTKIDGTGVTYQPDDAFYTSDTVNILYAMWQGKEKMVVLLDGLNELLEGNVVFEATARYGEVIEIPTLSNPDKIFFGYNESFDGTGRCFVDTIKVETDEEMLVLYAEWQPLTGIVSFNTNGGIGSLEDLEIDRNTLKTFDNSEIEEQRNNVSKKYYTLVGWSEDPTATTGSFEVIVGATDKTYYAVWQRNKVTISYIDQNGVFTQEEIDQGSALQLKTLTKDGYFLKGYQFNGLDYGINDTINLVEEDIQISLVWNKLVVINFVNGGEIDYVYQLDSTKTEIGRVETGLQIYAPKASIPYKDVDGTRLYFVGWSTEVDGEPTWFVDEEILEVTGEQVFYAVYKEASTQITFTASGTTAYTAQYNGTALGDDGLLVIPNTYNGKPVTSVVNSNNSLAGVKRVVMAEGIKVIGEYAFSYSDDAQTKDKTGITSVLIPNSVTNIYTKAFYKYNQKLTRITLSEEMICLNSSAFEDSSNLVSVSFNDKLQAIFDYAFAGCDLNNAILQDQVVYMSTGVFQENYNMKKARISSKLTYVSSKAFYWCDSLEEVELQEGIVDIQNEAFANCTSLKNAILPNSLQHIGTYAFDNCYSMESVSFGANISYIEQNAFMYCDGLQKVSIIDLDRWMSITFGNIYANPLNTAKNLYLEDQLVTSVSIPYGTTTIRPYIFYNAECITNVDIPDTVTRICEYALEGTNAYININGIKYNDGWILGSLKNVTGEVNIPNGAKAIADSAFNAPTYSCGFNKIVVPQSVEYIGQNAFGKCKALTSLTLPYIGKTITSTSTEGYLTWLGNLYIRELTITGGYLVAGSLANLTTLATLNIMNDVTGIDASALAGCTNLTHLRFENTSKLTSLPSSTNAFQSRPKLKTITFKNTVFNSIGSVFKNNTALDTIVFEGTHTMTLFGGYAFENCTALKTITLPSSLTTLAPAEFKGCTALETVFFPKDCKIETFANEVFNNCTALKTVTIPSSVKQIAAYGPSSGVFSGCTSLEEVKFEEGSQLFNIGSGAFYNCTSLTLINLPNTLTTISNNAFGNCTALKTITIPASVTTISSATAFGYCSSLEEVIFEDGIQITDLGTATFVNCTALKSIRIPASIVNLNSTATFYNCSALVTITFEEGSKLESFTTYDGCTSLANIDFTNCVNLKNAYIGQCAITSINYGLFKTCTLLENVTLNSSSITAVTDGAFNTTPLLKTIIFGSNCTKLEMISNNAFNGTALTSLTIPASVKTITNGSLCNLPNLTTLNFASNSELETINNGTLCNFPLLSAITLPNSLKILDGGAFGNCPLLTSVTIPASIVTLGGGIFQNCTGLTSVTIAENNNLTTLTNGAFYRCTNLETLIINGTSSLTTINSGLFSGFSKLKTVVLPDSVTSIGSGAFAGCIALTSINMPANLTTLGNSAFTSCVGLTSINLPASLTTLEGSSFSSCIGLTTVVVPDSVTSIGSGAFAGCSGLTSITLSFVGTSASATTASASTCFGAIFGPGSVEGTTAVTQYGTTYYIPTGLTTVVITGGTLIYDNAFSGCTMLTSVTLPSTLTTIGGSAFYSCTGLISIEIPNTVTKISSGAFSGCTNLISATVAENSVLTTFEISVFSECSSLKSFHFPKSVQSLMYAIFYNCTSLETVTFEEGINLSWINGVVFSGCTSLKEIIIPASVTLIGHGPGNAFQNCINLTSVTFEEGSQLTTLGDGTFSGCTALAEISLPATLTSIGSNAFSGCTSLTTIDIPNSVTTVSAGAFAGCTGLTKVTFGSGIESVDETAFSAEAVSETTITEIIINNDYMYQAITSADVFNGAFANAVIYVLGEVVDTATTNSTTNAYLDGTETTYTRTSETINEVAYYKYEIVISDTQTSVTE